ncbi:hypothetical protein N665_1311s0004 [Sinapis alba]|nr:hypothetical protein N665_1311s0004 [Sinapis alba]
MDKVEYLNELQVSAEKLIHSYGVLFLVTLFLKWVTSFAAILLLTLDGTKWKSTNMWTSLLAPYLFISLPLVISQFLSVFAANYKVKTKFAESLEVPGATLLLTVAAPNFFMETFRDRSDNGRSRISVLFYELLPS